MPPTGNLWWKHGKTALGQAHTHLSSVPNVVMPCLGMTTQFVGKL